MSESIVLPEAVYAKQLNLYQRAGLSVHAAEMLAADRQRKHIEARLGKHYFLTVNAAQFMATCLCMKRMPAGASRWKAQDAPEEWIPYMPSGERAEVLTTLRCCSPSQLGPTLTAMVADYS